MTALPSMYTAGDEPTAAAVLTSESADVWLRAVHVPACCNVPWHHRARQHRLRVQRGILFGNDSGLPRTLADGMCGSVPRCTRGAGVAGTEPISSTVGGLGHFPKTDAKRNRRDGFAGRGSRCSSATRDALHGEKVHLPGFACLPDREEKSGVRTRTSRAAQFASCPAVMHCIPF